MAWKRRVHLKVVTSRGHDLLGDCRPRCSFDQVNLDVELFSLPFECHALLRDNLGKYDYYCYLEDDLILHDPWLFDKLRWFNQQFGSDCLLQPNRYEVSAKGPVHKAYIDGDLAPRVTAPLQDVHDRPMLTAEAFGRPVEFVRPLNPHSGCFFLNAEQMEHWAKQPYFLDRDTSFIGPLESAATLGIMKTFRVYKPAPANADFLEIQHYGTAFLSLIGKTVRLEGGDASDEAAVAQPPAPVCGEEPPHPRPLSPKGERGEEASAPAPVHPDGADGKHLLFVHQNYPAQFGHIAAQLVKQHGYRCTFVSQKPAGVFDGVERVQYFLRGGATSRTHYCSRTFENMTWHADAVYRALRARPDLKPDLIVGHAGLGPCLFLRELYDCPIVNYFEWFYHPSGGDLDFRPLAETSPPNPPLRIGEGGTGERSSEWNRLRARARNAMLLLDLDNCDASYSPTEWQRDRFPQQYRAKIQVIFDGIDTSLWRRNDECPCNDECLMTNDERMPNAECRMTNSSVVRDSSLDILSSFVLGHSSFVPHEVPAGTRVVTYVSRGFESMRGFDVFMKLAKRLCDRRQDVLFLVVGQDRCCYSGDERVTGKRSFKEWVLSQDDYDLSRIRFAGLLPPRKLARLLARSDLHVYLTAPFVLSWSLLNALACGATVLASDTPPVREVIRHEHNGLLADFFDLDALEHLANKVLDDPGAFKPLGAAGAQLIQEKYSLEACLPRLVRLYEETARPAHARRRLRACHRSFRYNHRNSRRGTVDTACTSAHLA